MLIRLPTSIVLALMAIFATVCMAASTAGPPEVPYASLPWAAITIASSVICGALSSVITVKVTVARPAAISVCKK